MTKAPGALSVKLCVSLGFSMHFYGCGILKCTLHCIVILQENEGKAKKMLWFLSVVCSCRKLYCGHNDKFRMKFRIPIEVCVCVCATVIALRLHRQQQRESDKELSRKFAKSLIRWLCQIYKHAACILYRACVAISIANNSNQTNSNDRYR